MFYMKVVQSAFLDICLINWNFSLGKWKTSKTESVPMEYNYLYSSLGHESYTLLPVIILHHICVTKIHCHLLTFSLTCFISEGVVTLWNIFMIVSVLNFCSLKKSKCCSDYLMFDNYMYVGYFLFVNSKHVTVIDV